MYAEITRCLGSGIPALNAIWVTIARMNIDINALARVGARARLAELAAEMDSIRRAFPETAPSPVKQRVRRHAKKATADAAEPEPAMDTPAEAAAPAKRTMSPEARARISAAQKRRWRKQRKTAKSA
jgi:hypothetical protein